MRNCRMTAGGSLGLILAAAMVAFIQGCAGVGNSGGTAGTYDGPVRQMGNGRAYTFVTLDAAGKPTAIGIRMSEAVLSGLPTGLTHDGHAGEYVLSLPKEAETSGYNHVEIDWNPKGHPPPGVYDIPHFDFHFYLISPEQRNRITAKGDDLARTHKAPAPDFMPEGYILPEGTEVPRMGAHAVDPASPEFHKRVFTKTFVYGFYDGSMAFLEPMATRAFLETKPNVTDPVKLPKAYARQAYYPTRYSVKYDGARREYVISLEDLIYR